MKDKLEYCDKCGTKLIFAIEGNCCGAKCPNCNVFKTVSTYNDPIEFDTKDYELYIEKNDYSAKKAYIIAKSLNCDITKATKYLNGVNVLIFKGKAKELLEILNTFEENNINVFAPNFPYKKA